MTRYLRFTSGQPSNTPSHPTCWGSSQWSHTDWLSLACRAMEPGHLLHFVLTCPSNADERHLKSRHSFVTIAQLISSSDNNNIRAAHWADHQWNVEWADKPIRLCIFIPDTSTHLPGATLRRRAWVWLNRLHTGVGRFHSYLYKCVMVSSVACESSTEEQTVNHVVLHCLIHRLPHGLHGLTVLDHDTIKWLLNMCPEILSKHWLEQLAQKKNSLLAHHHLCYVDVYCVCTLKELFHVLFYVHCSPPIICCLCECFCHHVSTACCFCVNFVSDSSSVFGLMVCFCVIPFFAFFKKNIICALKSSISNCLPKIIHFCPPKVVFKQ